MFNMRSMKHRMMRDLLIMVGVQDPENPRYYSAGGTVTIPGLREIKEGLRKAPVTLN